MELHEEAATVTLWLAIVTALVRVVMYYFDFHRGWLKWTSFMLFVVLMGFVVRTGFLGGELVFKHGAGIELVLPDFGEPSIE